MLMIRVLTIVILELLKHDFIRYMESSEKTCFNSKVEAYFIPYNASPKSSFCFPPSKLVVFSVSKGLAIFTPVSPEYYINLQLILYYW